MKNSQISIAHRKFSKLGLAMLYGCSWQGLACVHFRKKSKTSRKLLTSQHTTKTFDTGFALARDTRMKLLHQGPPENWDELVISPPDTRSTS